MVVVPVQKGMNNIGLWVYDKYETLQEISVVLDENKNLQSQVDELTEENNQLKQDVYRRRVAFCILAGLSDTMKTGELP